MKKLVFLSALLFSGYMSAQILTQQGVKEGGEIIYPFTSTCGEVKTFISSGELTITEALIIAKMYNTKMCGNTVRRVIIDSGDVDISHDLN